MTALDRDNVREDRIRSGTISFNDEGSPLNWVDLLGQGPAMPIPWGQHDLREGAPEA